MKESVESFYLMAFPVKVVIETNVILLNILSKLLTILINDRFKLSKFFVINYYFTKGYFEENWNYLIIIRYTNN